MVTGCASFLCILERTTTSSSPGTSLITTNILNRISKLNSVSPVRRAFFYIFSSFTSSLPWASCDNPWNTEACRRFDSKNCTELGGMMTNQQECVFQKDVTIDVWKNISETTRNAKMPSDEFFQWVEHTFHSILVWFTSFFHYSNFMLDISNGIHDIGEVRLELAGCLLLAWTLVYCALWKGIKSFGKLVYFTALFPYCILIILLVRAATLPGYMDGISFYLTPKWEKLLEINVSPNKPDGSKCWQLEGGEDGKEGDVMDLEKMMGLNNQFLCNHPFG